MLRPCDDPEWSSFTRFFAQNFEGFGLKRLISTSSARNAGLEIARGEYIGFVDPDDWIEAQAYELALEAARRTGADIVQWGHFYEEEGKSQAIKNMQEGFFSIAENPECFSELVWNKLFRASLLLENNIAFPPGVRYGQDRDFSLVASALSKRSFCLNAGLCRYNAAWRLDPLARLLLWLRRRRKGLLS